MRLRAQNLACTSSNHNVAESARLASFPGSPPSAHDCLDSTRIDSRAFNGHTCVLVGEPESEATIVHKHVHVHVDRVTLCVRGEMPLPLHNFQRLGLLT